MNRWLKILLANTAIVATIAVIVVTGVALALTVAHLTGNEMIGFLSAFAITAVLMVLPAKVLPVVIVAVESALGHDGKRTTRRES